MPKVTQQYFSLVVDILGTSSDRCHPTATKCSWNIDRNIYQFQSTYENNLTNENTCLSLYSLVVAYPTGLNWH